MRRYAWYRQAPQQTGSSHPRPAQVTVVVTIYHRTIGVLYTRMLSMPLRACLSLQPKCTILLQPCVYHMIMETFICFNFVVFFEDSITLNNKFLQ